MAATLLAQLDALEADLPVHLARSPVKLSPPTSSGHHNRYHCTDRAPAHIVHPAAATEGTAADEGRVSQPSVNPRSPRPRPRARRQQSVASQSAAHAGQPTAISPPSTSTPTACGAIAASSDAINELHAELARTRADVTTLRAHTDGALSRQQLALEEDSATRGAAVEQLEVELARTRAEVNALKKMLAHSRCEIGAVQSGLDAVRQQHARALLGSELTSRSELPEATRQRLRLA